MLPSGGASPRVTGTPADYKLDWQSLYRAAREENGRLEGESNAVRIAADAQRVYADDVALELSRIAHGGVAPSWVVSELDGRLSSVERQLKAAEAKMGRLQDDRAALCEMLFGEDEPEQAAISSSLSTEHIRRLVGEIRARKEAARRAAERSGGGLAPEDEQKVSDLMSSWVGAAVTMEAADDGESLAPAESGAPAASVDAEIDPSAMLRSARASREAAALGASADDIVAAGRDAARRHDAPALRPADPHERCDGATRDEMVELLRGVVGLRSERAGKSAEASAAAVEEAVVRLDDALNEGFVVADALTIAICATVDEAAVVSTTVQRVAAEHGENASPLALVAAADAAVMLVESGAPPKVCCAAGESAAVGVIARENSFEEVHEDAAEMAEVCREKYACVIDDVEIVPPSCAPAALAPNVSLSRALRLRLLRNLTPRSNHAAAGSMDKWLQSLHLEKVVIDAARRRFDAVRAEQHGDTETLSADQMARFERAFVEHLAKRGSVEMVACLLKESPVGAPHSLLSIPLLDSTICRADAATFIISRSRRAFDL